MRTIVSLHTDSEHVSVDACIVWCFDPRFSNLLRALEEEEGFFHTDIIKVAGGAKDLTDSSLGNSKDYLLDQIGKSVALHHPRQIILMMHDNCGAYGGREDPEFYKRGLRKAGDVLERFLKKGGERDGIPIELIFCDFEGAHILE